MATGLQFALNGAQQGVISVSSPARVRIFAQVNSIGAALTVGGVSIFSYATAQKEADISFYVAANSSTAITTTAGASALVSILEQV